MLLTRRCVLSFALSLGVVCALPLSALARQGGIGPACGDDTVAWLKDAARDLKLDLSPVHCAGSLARVRLSPKGSLPLDVEVAEPPGPAFAKAGRLRVSPIVNISDFKLLPKAQRDAFEAFRNWLERHEDRVAFSERHADPGKFDALAARATPPKPAASAATPAAAQQAPAGRQPMQAPWFLFLAAGLCVGFLARDPSLRPRSWRIPLGIFIAGLATRLVFGLWGPLHVNGQGPMWIRRLVQPSELASYGPGYPELFGWLTFFDVSIDQSLFFTNAVVSAFVPLLWLAIAKSLELSRCATLFLAAVWLIDPVAIRCATSESYFVPIIALVLIAHWLFFVGLRGALARDISRAGLCLVACGLIVGSAARIHPVAYLPLALVPLTALCVPSAESFWRRLAHIGLGAVVVAAVSAAISLGALLDTLQRAATHSSLSLAGADSRLLFAGCVIAVAGYWLGRRHQLSTPGPLLVVILTLVAWTTTRSTFGQHPLWQANYDRLFFPALIIASSGYVDVALKSRVASAATALAVAFALWLPTADFIATKTTEQLEYAFLRRELQKLPDDCALAAVLEAKARIVDIPDYLLPGSSSTVPRLFQVHSADDVLVHVSSRPCIAFLRSSICSSAEARPTCASIESGLSLAPLAEAGFPAVPSYRRLRYDVPRVSVKLSRVVAP